MTDAPQARLTPAERAVFLCVMDGLDDAESAVQLGCSVWTVRIHKAAIRAKLGGEREGRGWWIVCARAYERTRGCPSGRPA